MSFFKGLRFLNGKRAAKSSFVHRCRLLLVAALVLLNISASARAEPDQLPYAQRSDYRIAVHCGRKVLQLWHKTNLVREYPVEAGKGGLFKSRSGDHKTPIGDYEVSWMASRIYDKGHRIIAKKSWCKDNRFVHADTGPKLEKLWASPYGLDHATVISINYPNPKESLMGFTGDCIHIHADKRLAWGVLKPSYGCIHMFPGDAVELYRVVDVGTPVKILP
ncbi:MAG: L,D-transpeptidase [Pseudomonadota bacterium]